MLDWDARLSPLADRIAGVSVSDDTWPRILQQIEAQRAKLTAAANDNVVGLRHAVRRWQAATLIAGAVAATLALFAIDRNLLQTGPAPQAGSFLAAVNRGGDMPALIVRVDLAAHVVTVRPVDTQTPPGKSLELWYIAAGQAPKSMGVVGLERERMATPPSMEPKNAVFAVTVEPLGGSPSGRRPVLSSTRVCSFPIDRLALKRKTSVSNRRHR